MIASLPLKVGVPPAFAKPRDVGCLRVTSVTDAGLRRQCHMNFEKDAAVPIPAIVRSHTVTSE